MKRLARFLLLATAAVCLPVFAQYPEKPVRLIVPFAAGGSADAIGRVFAERLGTALGQPIVVENRGGAGGNLAFGAVAKSPPDGYTLLLASPNLTTNAALYSSVPFDPIADFAPIAMLTTVPNMLVVHPSLPFKSVADLVAYAKANPGKLNYGSPESGSSVHLGTELFKALTGTDIVHVSFRGPAQAVTDLLAGRVQLMLYTTPPILPHVKSGGLRPLAIATRSRLPELPEVPTFGEAGYPDLVTGAWVAIAAPAGTPQPIIERLNRELTRIAADEAVAAKIRAMGGQAISGSPAEVAAFFRAETARWGAIIKASGAKAE